MLLYELLTGQTPFDAKAIAASGSGRNPPHHPGTGAGAALDAFEHDGCEGDLTTVPPANVTDGAAETACAMMRGDLDWIVMKALEKDRTRRYETANGLAAGHSAPSEATNRCWPVPPSNLYRFQKLAEPKQIGLCFRSVVASSRSSLLWPLPLWR